MRVLLILATLAACGDDGMIDPRPDAARRGPIDGDWSLSWTCHSGCESGVGDVIARLQSDDLSVAYTTLTFVGSTVETDTADSVDGSCLGVAEAVDGLRRRAYEICRVDSRSLRALISWSAADDSWTTTWALLGVEM